MDKKWMALSWTTENSQILFPVNQKSFTKKIAPPFLHPPKVISDDKQTIRAPQFTSSPLCESDSSVRQNQTHIHHQRLPPSLPSEGAPVYLE